MVGFVCIGAVDLLTSLSGRETPCLIVFVFVFLNCINRTFIDGINSNNVAYIRISIFHLLK